MAVTWGGSCGSQVTPELRRDLLRAGCFDSAVTSLRSVPAEHDAGDALGLSSRFRLPCGRQVVECLSVSNFSPRQTMAVQFLLFVMAILLLLIFWELSKIHTRIKRALLASSGRVEVTTSSKP
jgi:hypothetical protein